MEVIKEELVAVREEFGDPRLTEIEVSKRDLTVADLIPEETVVVTLSHRGYAKNQPLADYQAQRQGGHAVSRPPPCGMKTLSTTARRELP